MGSSATSSVRFTAQTPRVSLLGLDLSDIIQHKSFRLDAVRIDSPVLSELQEKSGKKAPPEVVGRSIVRLRASSSSTGT